MSAFGSIALLAGLFAAQEIDATAGGRLETAAGKVPVPGGESENAATFEASPAAGLVLTDHRHRTTAAYNPRIFFRAADVVQDPLLLHRFNAGHRRQLDGDLTLDLGFAASSGSVDYSRAASSTVGVAPGLEGGVTPEVPVIRLMSLSGGIELTKMFGSDSLEFALRPSYSAPLGDGGGFPTQLRSSLSATYTDRPSRIDDLTYTVSGEVIDFQTGTGTAATSRLITTAEATLRWERDVSRDLRLIALGGISASFGAAGLLPVAELGFTADLIENTDVRMTGAGSVGLDAFANPVLATFEGRFGASLGFAISVPPHVTIGGSASFFTPVLGEEAATMTLARETVLSARVPVTYRFGDGVTLEAGVRTSARAPRLGSESFDFGELELVGFVVFAVSVDTRQPSEPM